MNQAISNVPALVGRSSDLGTAGSMPGDRVLTTKATADVLGVSQSVLRKWRMHDGKGPRFIRFSKTRVGYRESALWAFVKSRERGSTLEA